MGQTAESAGSATHLADSRTRIFLLRLITMMIRTAKVLLLCGVALFHTLVVFNNLTDYGSNAQFVRHVLLMDTTFPGNHGMWRAIASPAADTAFYISIIVWEMVTAILLWWGAVRLLRALRQPAAVFNGQKSLPVAGLTFSLLMWLVAFLSVGGEWFLMWQSRVWNGQETAFRNFAAFGIVLLILMQLDSEVEA
jgi:predicted small integral membrane protein